MGEPQAITELHCGWIQNTPGGLVGVLGTNCSEVVGRSVDKSQHHPNYPRWCCGGCRKCSLQEEPSFHIVCECNALAGIRKRVLVQAYPDAVNIRDSELRLSGKLLPGNGTQKANESRFCDSWFAGLAPQIALII